MFVIGYNIIINRILKVSTDQDLFYKIAQLRNDKNVRQSFIKYEF